MADEQTTRRQITHEERDIVVDYLYGKAAEALGIEADKAKAIKPEQWDQATAAIERAAALTREPRKAVLKTSTAKAGEKGDGK